jgi:hypothetical protein
VRPPQQEPGDELERGGHGEDDEVPVEAGGVVDERSSLRLDAREEQEQAHQGEPQAGPGRDEQGVEHEVAAGDGLDRSSQPMDEGTDPEQPEQSRGPVLDAAQALASRSMVMTSASVT